MLIGSEKTSGIFYFLTYFYKSNFQKKKKEKGGKPRLLISVNSVAFVHFFDLWPDTRQACHKPHPLPFKSLFQFPHIPPWRCLQAAPHGTGYFLEIWSKLQSLYPKKQITLTRQKEGGIQCYCQDRRSICHRTTCYPRPWRVTEVSQEPVRQLWRPHASAGRSLRTAAPQRQSEQLDTMSSHSTNIVGRPQKIRQWLQHLQATGIKQMKERKKSYHFKKH